MFKRTLSALLAVITVFSSFAVFTIGSSAADYYVRGSVTSVNPQNAVTVELKKGDVTVYTGTIAATEGNGDVTQDFEITGVAPDTYDLVVSKKGHLSATITGIAVNGNITLSKNNIVLVDGDISCDGYIDGTDVSLLVADLGKSAVDASNSETDITGDGYRDSVDVARLAFNLLKPANKEDYVDTAPDTPPEDEITYKSLLFQDCNTKYSSYGTGFSTVTSGAPDGSGYFTATSDNCPVIMAKPKSAIDISDYIEGGFFTFKLYVDDVTNLKSGVGVDLWQGGKCDYSWNAIPANTLTNGWNDVTLYIADMKKADGDFTAISTLRTYAYSKSGNITIAIDDIYVHAPGSKEDDKVMMYRTVDFIDCEAKYSSYGIGFSFNTTNAPVGNGYYSATDSSCPVIVATPKPAVDLSDYSVDGYFTFKLYVDDVTNLKSGVGVDLWQSGEPVCAWNAIPSSLLTNGWNDVTLYVSDMKKDIADYSAMGAIRIYAYSKSGDITIGIDDVKVTAPYDPEAEKFILTFDSGTGTSITSDKIEKKHTLKLPECSFTKEGYTFIGWKNDKFLYEPGYLYKVTKDETLTAQWVETSSITSPEIDYSTELAMSIALSNYVIYNGSENSRAAIANTLKKAEAGEDITIVAFGTSTCGGAGASEGNGWLHIVTRWFEETFPNANITLVNSGIGSSESVLGAARFQKECIDHNPDLVLFGMGSNDNGLPHGEEAYEGILTQLVQSGTPVFSLNTRKKDGSASTNIWRQPLNELYDIPSLDVSAYSDMYLSINPPKGFSADEMWTSDEVHPSNRGHQLMAELAIHFLEGIYADYKSGTLIPDIRFTDLPTAKTDNRYADSILYQNYVKDTEQYSYTLNGFTADFDAIFPVFHTDMDGWQADSVGDKITFKTTAGYFAMFFANDDNGGKVKISVDGVQVAIKDTYSASSGWPHSYNFTYHVNDGLEHIVEVEVIESDNGSYVGLTAVALANFAD